MRQSFIYMLGLLVLILFSSITQAQNKAQTPSKSENKIQTRTELFAKQAFTELDAIYVVEKIW